MFQIPPTLYAKAIEHRHQRSCSIGKSSRKNGFINLTYSTALIIITTIFINEFNFFPV